MPQNFFGNLDLSPQLLSSYPSSQSWFYRLQLQSKVQGLTLHHMNPHHVRLLVGLSVGQLVCRSVISPTSKFPFHALIGALAHSWTYVHFPVNLLLSLCLLNSFFSSFNFMLSVNCVPELHCIVLLLYNILGENIESDYCKSRSCL